MKMRDKREVQRQDKEQHLAAIQAVKARRQQAPILARAAPVREENPVLLIVCQGTNTEVQYFEHFELATADIKAVGLAYDPVTLVREAIRLRDDAKRDAPYEQVWCVFDKDDSSPEQFHAAIQIAAANEVEVAYSNQAFEFWLLLHFDDHQGGGMTRERCADRLSGLIREANPKVSFDGKKGKDISRALFDLLESDDPTAEPGRLPRRKVAIGRARAIAKRWADEGTEPAYHESATEVYRLVMVLQRHLEPI
ncbi:RloB family protein [uncultured Hymenobacter sp.]|uniref:RloB family protein n=1 Tax=uncultured Hymenobacter sp. TaxID=170016 RepID=UPI0035CB2B1F